MTIPTIVTGPVNGTIVTIADNGTITYTPNPNTQSVNNQPVDSFRYSICDTLAAFPMRPLCDSAEVYIYVSPRNLPPTADTIIYTQLVTVPQDVNVSLSTSDPNSDPLTISMVGDSTDGGLVNVTKNGNGNYTITSDSIGTYVIKYRVCDTDQYQVHVLCDTSVIIAYIVQPSDTLTPQPPVANNDFATTTGTTPATVNVRGNDYSDPTNHGLTMPGLVSNHNTPDGTWYVDGSGNVVFQPNAGLAPGIYYDTVYYKVCDLVDIPTLCSTAYVVVTTNVVDSPIANRPPVAVNDHETVPQNTTSSFNVKANDSDPDGDSLTISTIVQGPQNGTIVSIADDGTVFYRPHYGVHSINGAPVDSFEYRICDTLAAHHVSPLCSTAEVYIYVVPANIPPTADTIRYTQMDGIPQDVNVILATSDPNSDPLSISMVGDSTAGGNLTVIKTGNGSYTITGADTGTFVIHYQVCDSDRYRINVLCDTSVIIAHIITPSDTLIPQPPVANSDFATTTGTIPATVNVRGNDYSNPTSHGLTTPVLISTPNTPDGTWSVDSNGNVVFNPKTGLKPGIYYDTVQYRICDQVDVPQLCATSYVVVTTDEMDTPIANRPPVAVNDHVTVQEDTTSSFNVKTNDSDPDGNPLTIPTIVTGPVNGTIVSVADNGRVTYLPNPGVQSVNHQPADSFMYYICDTLAAHTPKPLCDSAEAYIYIYNVLHAVNDTVRTGCHTPIVICVKNNDFDTEHQPFNVKGVVTPPAHGTATLDTVTQCVTYAPDGFAAGFANGIIDSFRYVDKDLIGATDTAWVFVKVQCCVVLAVSDTFNLNYGGSLYANVLKNDMYNDTFPQTVTILAGSGPAHGIATVVGDSILYTPIKGFCGADGFSYILSDMCGQDTALVEINVLCDSSCNKPVAVNDVSAHGYICNDTINVLANDTFQVGATVSVMTPALYGRDTVVNNEVVYIPDGTHPNTVDSIVYIVCNQPCGLCDTATVLIHLSGYPCNVYHPIVVNDTVATCANTNVLINVLSRDSDPNGEAIFISHVNSGSHGTTFNHGDTLILYQPDPGFVGIDSFGYLVCNTGVPNLCNNAFVFINIIPCLPPPVVVDTLIRDTIMSCSTATVCIDSIYQRAGYVVHFTGFCDSAKHGTVTLSSDTVKADSTGKLCFTYTASCDTSGGVAPYRGNDTICLVICDIGSTDTACAVSHIIITILPPSPHPVAIEDCSDTTTYMNVPGIINVLGNDILFAAQDTLVTIVLAPDSGVAVVNGDLTITYVPNHGFFGHDSLRYQVCEIVGPDTNCSTAVVCINVIDTAGNCFYPNGFSPNSDGVNDVMVFPCNDRYPNSALLIFNRWGDVVWEVTGGYKNDWNGVNQSGTPVPDGTYYFVYKYNDGSGRSEARFIVINR